MKGLALIGLVVLAWGLGLLAFAARVQRLTPAPPPPRSDAIVALTGASNVRLAAATELLERGEGARLLISGVNPAARRSDLRGVVRDFGREWDCCVDLGRAAEDTRGNASETADWTRRHGYRSLIVVTADYHMPRALLELGASMPGVALRPYPVETGTVTARGWWRRSTDARRMAVEYCKYLLVWARTEVTRLGDGPAAAGRAAA